MPSPRPHRPLHVTIVADNSETLDGLEGYFRAAGVTTKGTRQIANAATEVAANASAVVIFPDDFAADTVVAALRALQRERARTLIVLVTKDPKPFERLRTAEKSAPPLVVPKPIWGWSILEAIRGRLESDEAQRLRR